MTEAELAIRQRTCQSCGMLMDDGGEYHPYEFCLLRKGGIADPWVVVERFARDLNLGPVPRGILVRNLPAKDPPA